MVNWPGTLVRAWLCLILLCNHHHQAASLGEGAQDDADMDLTELEAELKHEFEERHFTNEWAIHVEGGPEVADQVARELGYRNTGQIGALSDYYLLVKEDHPARAKRSADHHTRALKEDHRVKWVEQQYSKIRVKRDFIDKREEEKAYRNVRFSDREWNNQWYLEFPEKCRTLMSMERRKRATISAKDEEEAYAIEEANMHNDELWVCQFYLYDSRHDASAPKLDLHVIPVWDKNITGKDVRVSILDDGLEWDHGDLKQNYDPDISFDFNGNDPDPMPRYDSRDSNKHGTRCAGEIAMVANNQKCGVGVAYNAKIGGVRMLDGTVTDSLEALALAFAKDKVDIYSSSWGPNDDGKTVEAPGPLASKAMETAINEGRGGKGVLYVWASGNGGSEGDNCNCDGYTSSIYTISISSASQSQESPWYSERCSSTMACTYSSGTMSELRITSTDIHDMCTTSHTGTSASAPLAAGIFALLLEANPNLTWRDVQHLVAWTSETAPLQCGDEHESSYEDQDDDDETYGKVCEFTTNGAGFRTNNHFGFGLLNAAGLVNASDPQHFQTVPEKSVCVVSAKDTANDMPLTLLSGKMDVVTVSTTGCEGQDAEVRYLEHVEVVLNMEYSRRGELEVALESPAGTVTWLLTRRGKDSSRSGFQNWSLMSVHTWGENPKGDWKLTIQDRKGKNQKGEIDNVELRLHGTKEQPKHVADAGGRRTYNDDYNSVTNKDTQGQRSTEEESTEDVDDEKDTKKRNHSSKKAKKASKRQKSQEKS